MTTWTNESALTTTWTNESEPLLVQSETLYNDTNTYNLTDAGKGYYYNDRIAGGAYSESSDPSTTWTNI